MPIRWRVALFGAGLVMLAMLAFSVLVYALAALGASDQRDRELSTRSEQVALAVQQAERRVDGLRDRRGGDLDLRRGAGGGRRLRSAGAVRGGREGDVGGEHEDDDVSEESVAHGARPSARQPALPERGVPPWTYV